MVCFQEIDNALSDWLWLNRDVLSTRLLRYLIDGLAGVPGVVARNISLEELWLGIGVKHLAFFELWLGMTSHELWLGIADEHDELLSCRCECAGCG